MSARPLDSGPRRLERAGGGWAGPLQYGEAATLDAELRDVLESVRRSIGADAVSMLVTDLEGVELVARASIGSGPEIEVGLHIALGAGIAGRILESGLPLIIDDLEDVSVVSSTLATSGFRSVVGVPLLTGGRVVGVLHGSSGSSGFFDDDSVTALEALARPLALAIERAQFLESEHVARSEAERLALLLDSLQRSTAMLARARTFDDVTGAVQTGVNDLKADSLPVVELLGTAGGLSRPDFGPAVIAERIAELDPFVAFVFAADGRTVVETPLFAEGRANGLIRFTYDALVTFTTEEHRFFTALAEQAAVAIDRIELREVQSAVIDRLGFLEEAMLVMNGSLDRHEVLVRLAEMAVPRLADWAGIYVLQGDDLLERMVIIHRDPELSQLAQRLVGRFPPSRSATDPISQVLLTGVPLLVADVTVESRADEQDESTEIFARLGFRSAMYVPLTVRGTVVGVMTFIAGSERRQYDASDLQFAVELATRAAIAVANATAFESEHDLAAMLTDTVGPPELPHLPDVEIAARYLPAAPAPLGGDWFDAFELIDGGILLTVGDVAGHGLTAASVMVRLASAIQAYAAVGGEPDIILERLHSHFDRVRTIHPGDALMATVAIARLDPGNRVLRTASAGHPPFLHLHGDTVDFGPLGDRALISGFGGSPVVAHERELDPGDVVVFFTDGLVERRHEIIDEGLDRLAAVVLANRELPLEALCDAIVDKLAPSHLRTDDCCVLAFRFQQEMANS